MHPDFVRVNYTDFDIIYAPRLDVGIKVSPGADGDAEIAALDLPAYEALGDPPYFVDLDSNISLKDYDQITLGITSKCNLRCVYCYCDGGEHDDTMENNDIMTVIEQIPKMSKKEVKITLFSDGETMVERSTLFAALARIREIETESGKDITVILVTNGSLINEYSIEFLKKGVNRFQVSYDGCPEAQGVNRPNALGQSSHDAVAKGIRLIEAAGIPYHLRGTVTRKTVRLISESVRYIQNNFPRALGYHVEPATGEGRQDGLDPSVEDFCREFVKAHKISRDLGFKLITKVNLVPKKGFCGATTGPGLYITPNGDLTGCSRVTRKDDPLADKYIYGSINLKTGDLHFDYDKAKKLRQATVVDAYPDCEGCFARASCAGGCSAIRDQGGHDFDCESTRILTKYLILDRYENGECRNQVIDRELAYKKPRVEIKFTPSQMQMAQPTGFSVSFSAANH
jgi:uncharacterized protein